MAEWEAATQLCDYSKQREGGTREAETTAAHSTWNSLLLIPAAAFIRFPRDDADAPVACDESANSYPAGSSCEDA